MKSKILKILVLAMFALVLAACGNKAEPKTPPTNSTMHVVPSKCVKCGACIKECPVDAIEERDGEYYINPDRCIQCGRCKDACPIEAIEE